LEELKETIAQSASTMMCPHAQCVMSRCVMYECMKEEDEECSCSIFRQLIGVRRLS